MHLIHTKDLVLKKRINCIINEIIDPTRGFWRSQWESIGGPLCQGILSSSQYVGGGFSLGFRILGTLNGFT